MRTHFAFLSTLAFTLGVGFSVLAEDYTPQCGDPIIDYGVFAFYNGEYQGTANDCGITGSTFGDEYQCVEYARRFYWVVMNVDTQSYCWRHNAVDFFYEPDLGMNRFLNKESQEPPRPDDIIIFGKTTKNPYGHIAIVSDVTPTTVTIAEQNWSPTGSAVLAIKKNNNNIYEISPRGSYAILGWMRPKAPPPVELSTGMSIEVASNGAGVRSKAAGYNRKLQPKEAKGTIVEGPVYACSYWWWKIDFESGTDGWVAEAFLKPAGGGGEKIIFSEGWEKLALGYPRCEISVEGYTNCGFTADSGQWTVGEYTDVIPVGNRLTSVQVISGKRIKLGKANGLGGFLTSPRTGYHPLVPGMTLSFTDHTADLGASNTTSYVMATVHFNAPGFVPCPGTGYRVGGTYIEYVLEKEAGAALSYTSPCTARINVGKVNSFSRDLYKDFKDYLPFDPTGWSLLQVMFAVEPGGGGADPSLSATFDNIKVTVPQ